MNDSGKIRQEEIMRYYMLAPVDRTRYSFLQILASLLIFIGGEQGIAQPRPSWVLTLEEIIDREILDKQFPSFALVLVGRHGIIAEIARGHRGTDGGSP